MFSRFSEGPIAAQLLEQARAVILALRHNPDTAAFAAIAFSHHPLADTYLPALGYQRKPLPDYSVAKIAEPIWGKDSYYLSSLLADVIGVLQRHIQNEGITGGSVRQTIAAGDIDSDISRIFFSGYHEISTADQLLFIATALASISGPDWSLEPCETMVSRTLPWWPGRIAHHVRKAEFVNGLLCDTLTWVVLPGRSPANAGATDQIIHASFVGHQKKCKAAWAAIMTSKGKIKLPIDDGRGNNVFREATRLEGKDRYYSFWSDALSCGLSHLVIDAREGFNPRPGVPFAHIVGSDGSPDFQRFFKQLDRALRLPIQENWIEEIWTLAKDAQLITPLPSYGCRGFWIQADNDALWAKVISQCAGGNNPTGAILTFGSTHGAVLDDIAEEEDDV